MRTPDPTKHETRRTEILAAAGRCFARSGFKGATIAAICAEAQISPGHLYYYFESKEAIVRAMTEAALASAETRFRDMAAASDALTALIDLLRRAPAGDAKMARAILLDLLAEACRNPVIAAILRDHTQALREQLTAFLRAGQAKGQVDGGLDPAQAASGLLIVIDGAATMMVRDPDQDMDQCLKLARTLILRYLTPQGTAPPPPPPQTP